MQADPADHQVLALGVTGLASEIARTFRIRHHLPACGDERADALGNFIDRNKQLFVLRLEGGVQGKEPRPLHVPVGQMSERQQGVGIGE